MSWSRKQRFDFQAYFSNEQKDLSSVQIPEFMVRFGKLNKFEQVKYSVARAFRKALESKPKPAFLSKKDESMRILFRVY